MERWILGNAMGNAMEMLAEPVSFRRNKPFSRGMGWYYSGNTLGVDRMVKSQEPDLYTYLNYREFLKDWFAWKKTANSRYSHRLFARRAGQRSPSLLLGVMEGRRNLTPTTTQAFGKALNFGARKQAFFELLVDLEQAELPKDRKKAMDGILATKRFQSARKVQGDLFRVFGEWYFGAICELARCEGFRPEPKWIAQTLRPKISEKQASEALNTLLELGLLHRGEDGAVLAADEWMMPEEGTIDIAILKSHESMLERARNAVGSFSRSNRIALGFTGSVPKDRIPQLEEKMVQVFSEMASQCESEPRQVVVQMNFVLFPLSDPRGTV